MNVDFDFKVVDKPIRTKVRSWGLGFVSWRVVNCKLRVCWVCELVRW